MDGLAESLDAEEWMGEVVRREAYSVRREA